MTLTRILLYADLTMYILTLDSRCWVTAVTPNHCQMIDRNFFKGLQRLYTDCNKGGQAQM